MVSTVDDPAAAAQLAAMILPESPPRVDSMRFDDEPADPDWIGAEIPPSPPPAGRRARDRMPAAA
jgi:hypothetical protein